MSEHDVFKMIPSTAKTLLRNITRKKMKRTTHQRGIYYYRGKQYDCLRVVLNTKEQTISFKRELKVSYGTRKESLTYHYDTDILVKEFHEPSCFDENLRKVEYPFILNESEHFMQSVVLDKYFPSLEDYVKMHEMKDEFLQDIVQWEKTMSDRRKQRSRENWEKWETSNAQYSPKAYALAKSREKRTSS